MPTATATVIVNCPHCNAPTSGPLCEYCGTQVQPDLDYEQQKKALETYHHLLANTDETRRVNLLNNGFLPDDTRVLIDAGLRCVPLIRDLGYRLTTFAAAGRLKAVNLKLKLLAASDPDVLRAVKEFDRTLQDHRKSENNKTLIGLAMVIGGLVVFVGIVWFIASLFS